MKNNNLKINAMLIHKPTGITFENRKEAKQVMGQGRYKRLLARGEFEFQNTPKE